MADPLLDEIEIMQDLHTPVTVSAVARLQQASVGVMMDIYDRKVTRDHYCAMLGPCISMYGAMAKLYVLNNVRKSFYKGQVNAENLDEAIAELESNARSHIEHVKKVLAELRECPTSADPIQ